MILDFNGEILLFIGFKEGIMYILMIYLELGDEVFVFNLGYLVYWVVVNFMGVIIWEYKLEEFLGWILDFDVLFVMNLDKVKIMWVNYFNMLIGV